MMSYVVDGGYFSEAVSKAMDEVIREHNIACDKLTKEQFVNALKQAVACGDFVKYVQAGTDAQAVVYQPFAREQELLWQIEDLKEQLAESRSHGYIPR